MSPKTQTILIGIGAAAAAVIVYEVLFSAENGVDSVLTTWSQEAKVGGAVAVGGASAWFLLLLFA